MKDFLGNEVKVGDTIACIELGYKNLIKAKVLKICNTLIQVSSKSYGGKVKRTSNQFILIESEKQTSNVDPG